MITWTEKKQAKQKGDKRSGKARPIRCYDCINYRGQGVLCLEGRTIRSQSCKLFEEVQ